MFVTCFLIREIKFGMFLNSLHEMKMKLLMFSISERSSQTFSGNLMLPFLSILFITPIVFELPTLLLISSLINPLRNYLASIRPPNSLVESMSLCLQVTTWSGKNYRCILIPLYLLGLCRHQSWSSKR